MKVPPTSPSKNFGEKGRMNPNDVEGFFEDDPEEEEKEMPKFFKVNNDLIQSISNTDYLNESITQAELESMTAVDKPYGYYAVFFIGFHPDVKLSELESNEPDRGFYRRPNRPRAPKLDFAPFEMQNFIEDKLSVEVDDLSTSRYPDGSPSGEVYVKFFGEIKVELLSRIHGSRFKDYIVHVKLFGSASTMTKHLINKGQDKAQKIALQNKSQVPVLYVQHFQGEKESIEAFFGQFGDISEVSTKKWKNGNIFIIQFISKAAALSAASSTNGFQLNSTSLVVSLLYKKASERSFVIRGCSDLSWLENEIITYGPISSIKHSNNGAVYVMMESLDDSRAACTLLNKRVYKESTIMTHFIEYEYFMKVQSQ